MHRLLLAYSVSAADESGLMALIQYARDRGIEVLLPDRSPSADGTANWQTLDAVRQCTGVWALVTAAGAANDWVRHEISLARSQSKPVVVFVQAGVHWKPEGADVVVVPFDRDNVQQLHDQFLSNVDGWLAAKPRPTESKSGAGLVIGAIGAGLLLYWLMKDNK